jgi:hypothetical protein
LLRALKVLVWLVTAALAVSATGYVMMAIDGYDYWSPLFPPPRSLAETGLDLAWIGQLLALTLMVATWILLSLWITRIRDRIPTTWKHSRAGIWLWWFVPIAWFWKPRDIYTEIALAARPGSTGTVRRLVDRWWIAAVLFVVATYLGWFEFGAGYLAFAAGAVALTAGMAAYNLIALCNAIAEPEVTFETAIESVIGPLSGDSPVPPTVPGWYNDPTGQVSHQAYWDGGRFTGAVRPDPRIFPSAPHSSPKVKDPLRIWLIVVGIVLTAGLIVYTAMISVVVLEDPDIIDIARYVISW